MANDLQFTNGATSLLAATITAGDPVIQVGTGDGALFPSPTGSQYFYATLEDNAGNIEVVQCTSRTGDLLTCTRGVDGTIAQGFTLSITRVELRLTAAVVEEFLQLNGGVMTGDVDFASNSIVDAILSGPALSIQGGESVGTPMRGATGVSTNELVVPVSPGRATVGGADILAVGDDIVAQLDVAGLITLDSATVGVVIEGGAYLEVQGPTAANKVRASHNDTDLAVVLSVTDNLAFSGAAVAYTFDNDLSISTGNVLLNDGILDRAEIRDFTMTRQAITATATTDLDYSLGSYVELALAVNVTLVTFSNLPATAKFAAFRLKVTQGTGGQTITWPASVKWAQALSLVLSTGASQVDFIDLWTDDAGTTWYAAGNTDWS